MTTVQLQSALASDRPIFSRQRVSHVPPHPIIHLATSNLQVALVLANKSVQRINLTSKAGVSSSVDVVDLSKCVVGSSKVSLASLDPLGFHLLLAVRPGGSPETVPELIYLNRRNSNPRASLKARGHMITAIAWSTRNTSDTMTGPVLLATNKGVVFETEFDSGEEKIFVNSLERHWKQLIDLGKGQHMPITGIAYFHVEGTKRFFVLLCTSNRLYQFVGSSSSTENRPLLANVFNNRDLSIQDTSIELPGTLKSPSISFSYQTKERGKPFAKHPLYPKSFGCSTEAGIYLGKIDGSGNGRVTVDCDLLRYPENEGDKIPFTFLLTEYHTVLVYKSSIVGVCLLNQQVVFKSDFDPTEGHVRGTARDPISGAFYVFTDYVVHKFKVDREDRNIWRIYLEQGEFDLAGIYAQGDEDKLDQVLTKKAIALYDEGRFVDSAMHFAKTKCTFEEVALRFMQVQCEDGDKSALLNYLRTRLETIKVGSEMTQLTLIVVWVIENYLSTIRTLRNVGRLEDSKRVQDEFINLLRTPKVNACIEQSKSTIYDLLASHGDKHSLVQFAELMRDHDRLIKYHMLNGDQNTVLKILREQKKAELFYRHGPELMQAMPEKFVDALIEQGRNLSPVTRVLPSLVVVSLKHQELQAIRYLEFCINSLGRQEPALHNFLISLYVKHQPEKIDSYLEARGYDSENIPYDIEYTLRLFEENGLKRSTMLLYCILGQLDEAVDIALDVSLEHAEKCLEFAKSQDVKRKIWLKIAQYVVIQKKDIGSAMEYLRKSGNLINIEDILPFFPDFVTIDHFKEAICDALEKYSKRIETLRKDMEESSQAADVIRAEIQECKKRYIFVRSSDTCSVCYTYLMSRPFHLFNCRHKFHTECLVAQLTPLLTPARRRKLDDLQAELRRLEISPDKQSLDSKSSTQQPSKRECLQAEFDDLVASECPFCSELMIQIIDKPLINDEDMEDELSKWL